MKRRAFISVYDKVGLVEFAQNLVDKFDYEIVASGDTYDYLNKSGIAVTDCNEFSSNIGILPSDYSAMNETVFAGILANSSDVNEMNALEKAAIKPYDMVVVNLCPFEKIAIENTGDIDSMVNNIDIVGCALLRAAAKNYKNVTVITDKIDYYVALNANDFGRLKLAVKAFNLTSNYDKLICGNLSEHVGEQPFKTFNFEKIKDLPYGENLHQKASLFKTENTIDYEVLEGKELTFNNMLNASVALNIISEFFDVNCVAIIRHAKPCGVSLGRSLYEAYRNAFDCDPVSSFYGVVGFSKEVDLEVAKHLNSMSVEVVVAPSFAPEAVELFKDNTEIKLVKINTPLKQYHRQIGEEIFLTPFGALIQEQNSSELNKETFKVVTNEKPTAEQIEDAVFAWKIAKYGRTNCAVIARDFKTFAISQGQTNAVSAVEHALDYSCDNSKDAVLASDTVLTSEDTIYSAIQGRINLIIQPGGSIKDQKLIDVCNKYGISMITTGIRNYKQ